MKPYVEIYNRIMASSVFRMDGEDIDLVADLQRLGDALRVTPYIDWTLGEHTDSSLSNLVKGAYWSLSEWHAGQESASYAALCSLGRIYTPGLTMPPTEDEPSFHAYDACNQWFATRNTKGK